MWAGSNLTNPPHLQESGYFDAEHPANSRAELTIKAASIDTRNAGRDAHLRSNDFFDMDTYPEITFTSTAVEPVDAGQYRVTGDLTIKGVTRPVTIDFDYTGTAIDPYGNTRIGLEGKTTVNRKDGASTGTPLSKPAACSSARTSPSSSTCPPSAPPTPPDPCGRRAREASTARADAPPTRQRRDTQSD